MVAAYQKLDKILKAERHEGCQNRVVIGGLQALAPRWRAEALAGAQDETSVGTIERIAADLSRYAGADPGARQEIIGTILALLEQPHVAVRDGRPAVREMAASEYSPDAAAAESVSSSQDDCCARRHAGAPRCHRAAGLGERTAWDQGKLR